MDELLKAITELVRTGGALAKPALMGYVIIQVVSILMYPAIWGIVSFTIINVARMITTCIETEVNRLRQEAARDERRLEYQTVMAKVNERERERQENTGPATKASST